jgi:hypothetical protein
MELLELDDYFVNDIADFNKFTEDKGQKIITSSNTAIKKILKEIFGKDNIPQIGKRRKVAIRETDETTLNFDNPIKDMNTLYMQNIIQNNMSIFRAYSNAIYWLKHPYYDISSRNLGYYSEKQTNLTNYLKSKVIDWYEDERNKKSIEEIEKYIKKDSKNSIKTYITNMGSEIMTTTNGIPELHALSKIYSNFNIYVYDDNDILYLFSNGLIYNANDKNKKTINSPMYKKYHDVKVRNKSIHIKFGFTTNKKIPDEIDVLYIK